MKKKLGLSTLLTIIAIAIAIPAAILLTTKTNGSISYADATQIVTSGLLSGMNEAEVVKKLGEPDFRLELDEKIHLQFEIERETHVFKPDLFVENLCIEIDRTSDLVINVYVSD